VRRINFDIIIWLRAVETEPSAAHGPVWLANGFTKLLFLTIHHTSRLQNLEKNTVKANPATITTNCVGGYSNISNTCNWQSRTDLQCTTQLHRLPIRNDGHTEVRCLKQLLQYMARLWLAAACKSTANVYTSVEYQKWYLRPSYCLVTTHPNKLQLDTMHVKCTFFRYSSVISTVTLKRWLAVTRSLEMTLFDRSHDFLLMFSSNYGSILNRFWDIWFQTILQPWKVTQGYRYLNWYHSIACLWFQISVL